MRARTSLNEIPFAVAYSNRVGVLESMPPLADIAELNLKAYQVFGSLDNQLHIKLCRCWRYTGSLSQQKRSVLAQAKPWRCLKLPGAEYIEPSGNSYDAQFKRLDQIENKINGLGLAAVLEQKLVGETAEAKRIDRSQGDSTMMVVAQQMQDMIDNCLRFHAQYMQQPWLAAANQSRLPWSTPGAARDPVTAAALHRRHDHPRHASQELANGEVLPMTST